MSARRSHPRRAAPGASGRRPKAVWWKRWLVAPLVLLLCAVVPWLIPWPWQNSGSASAEPSASSTASAPAGATPEQDAAPGNNPPPADDQPDGAAVERLGKRIAEQKESYDLPVDRTEVRGVSTEPGSYTKLGRLAIPEVGLDVAFGEGVFAETLAKGPGHWPGTPMPGRAGNSVVSGHRNTNTQPFKRIDELKPGNKIIVTVEGQQPTTFFVNDTTIVPEPRYREFVLRQPEGSTARQLTIFACHPEGNPINRIVVRATAKD